jgi:transcriptional regulator GlxA family with amidase domain
VVAAKVAQALVVALRRGPQDAELSPFLAHRNHLHPAVHKVQDAVSQATRHDWSLANMAEVACTSTRHLTRLFETHAGVAPLQYLRSIRLAAAQTALHSGLNVYQAADMAGFSSDTQLRRAWHQAGLAGTPSEHAS